MYLVSAENFSAPKTKSPPLVVSTPPKLKNSPPLSKTRKLKKQHPYDRWVKFRKNMGEADITRKARMKAIADFLQKVLPEPASSHTETDAKKKKNKQPPRHFEVGTQKPFPLLRRRRRRSYTRRLSRGSLSEKLVMMMMMMREIKGLPVVRERMSAP